MQRFWKAIVPLALLGLVGAACGSDDDDETAAESATTAEDDAATEDETEDDAEPTEDETEDDGASGEGGASQACTGSGEGTADGEPIVVGSINTDESAAAAFPDLTDGQDACFAAVNESGGIDGRPVEYERCNDNADAVEGESCARDLIDAGAVAVLGGICFSCFSAPVVEVLGGAGIPYVGGLPVLPNEYTQENFYPVTNGGGSASLFSNAAYFANQAESEGVDFTVVEVYAQVGEADPTLEQAVTDLGGEYVARVGFDPAAADLSSTAQQAIDADASFISVQTDGPNTVKLVTALRQQGFEGDIAMLATAADPESLSSMGEAGEGVFVAQFFDNLSTGDTPDAEKFQADMEAAGHDPSKALAVAGYASAAAVTEALKAVEDEVNAGSFLAALETLEPIEAIFDGQLAADNATEDFPRTFYYTLYAGTVQDGAIELTGDRINWLTGEPIG